MSDVSTSRATSLIDSLLDRVRSQDASLANDLRRAIKSVTAEREFGLVFNRHLPETVELPGRAVRARDKVRIKDGSDGRTWRVTKVRRIKGQRVAELVSADADAKTDSQPVDNLVVIADFRDPIYPGLKSTDKVERGGGKPFHAVINAENAHALEALTFTHTGKVDCIYIDPPYNTRANDWKYNNDYVDPSDTYSHSKWLAFMERRLKLAKKLLNPADSVLIVTIDEKEVHRLGLLLEQTFPQARIQMVSTIINPKGVSTNGGFRRADEYIIFVMIGSAGPVRLELGTEWSPSPIRSLSAPPKVEKKDTLTQPEWTSMMRRGSESARADRPTMFYPIYADPVSRTIVEVGEPLPKNKSSAPAKRGLVTILPFRKNGAEGRWQVGADELRSRIEQGRVRLGRKTDYGFVVNYLPDGAFAEIESGKYKVEGHAADGSLIAYRADDAADERVAPTQWKIASHNASEYGSSLLASFIPGRSFPFPKSLYAVEDALRFFVKGKPDAIIVDFFAGSGTTTHAVMRLNRQDGGRRQSISITNNEVSADEQKNLRQQGLHPGDCDWEKWGICDYVTKPRIKAAVTGKTHDRKPVVGSYKFADEFPMSEGFEENVEFFTLTYEDAEAVRLDLAFTAVAPMLWLRAGGQGSRIDTRTDTFAVADHYGVLFDPDHWRAFVRELEKVDDLRCVYVVTDDDALFQRVTSKLPDEVNGRRLDVVRLYENYLNNFEINTTRV